MINRCSEVEKCTVDIGTKLPDNRSACAPQEVSGLRRGISDLFVKQSRSDLGTPVLLVEINHELEWDATRHLS